MLNYYSGVQQGAQLEDSSQIHSATKGMDVMPTVPQAMNQRQNVTGNVQSGNFGIRQASTVLWWLKMQW